MFPGLERLRIATEPLDLYGLLAATATEFHWSSRVGQVVMSLGRQLLWVVLPLVLFAAMFHLIEAVVQRRLVERFGWKAALWTGWIGTPIHETSHAILCWVFGHQIDAIALFEPDSREGRLGYVRHSYQRGDWWQEAGNLFIGLAPLAGGTLALMLLTSLMYPGLVQHFWETSQQWGAVDAATVAPTDAVNSEFSQTLGLRPTEALPAVDQPVAPRLSLWTLMQSTGYAFGQLLSWQNLSSFRFWLFLYLTLCITSHMAPSASDYYGAKKGGVLLAIAWLAVNLIHGLLGLSIERWAGVLAPIWQLVFSMLMLAVTLGLIVAAVVYLWTLVWDQVLQQVHR